jgi:anaerobic magnesium-protoporphyrin IX monomethyl ester cyclase
VSSVLLIYPYFKPSHDRSLFRFQPLGLAYLASSLRKAGHDVEILDCTFMARHDAMDKALCRERDVVGVYSMATMREDALGFAKRLRKPRSLLVAGGPLPSCDPISFMRDFDIVVKGEGERTIIELLSTHQNVHDFESIPGIVYRKESTCGTGKVEKEIAFTKPRLMENDLDSIAFPARDLLPNPQYIAHCKRRFGYAVTSIITTRGCPFSCEFCSNAVFGISYRERSPENVVDEVEQVLSLGYDRIHFGDDVFTLSRERIIKICGEIKARRLNFLWECLGRADSIDMDTARIMREAGCDRIFFGIESGNDSILKLIGKKITVESARKAVEATHRAGIRTGGFFIVCYPGETDRTVLDTVRFATSLPFDYLSFTIPYPLPGTALFERMKSNITKEWAPQRSILTDHSLIYNARFSEIKMKFAIVKGNVQFWLRKRLGRYSLFVVKPFEYFSDVIFKLMK